MLQAIGGERPAAQQVDHTAGQGKPVDQRVRDATSDDTQPRNTDPRLAVERPDVTVIDGGVAAIPGIDLRGDIGLPRGLAVNDKVSFEFFMDAQSQPQLTAVTVLAPEPKPAAASGSKP